jgi:hypothetical protein
LALLGSAASAQGQAMPREGSQSAMVRHQVVWQPDAKPGMLQASTPSHVGMWGAIAGTVLGAAYGYAMGKSGCDAADGRQVCVRDITIGGAIVGAAVGYGLERLFRWK